MTEEQFFLKLQRLAKIKAAIVEEYVMSNNPYQIGDIFTDHAGKIKIKSIKPHYCGILQKYYCLYYGRECRNSGKPYSRASYRTAHQIYDISNNSNKTNHEKD